MAIYGALSTMTVSSGFGVGVSDVVTGLRLPSRSIRNRRSLPAGPTSVRCLGADAGSGFAALGDGVMGGVLAADEGTRLQSGPGRDLIFKVTGEDTGGAFDYFVVEVAPHGGPPLHVHHHQEETVHVLSGRFKVRIGDEEFSLDPGGFAFMPSGLPHAFLNLTDED